MAQQVSADPLGGRFGDLRPGWWVIPLTLVMVVIFAGSGWATSGIGDDLGGQLAMIAVNTLPLLALRRNPLAVVLLFSVAYPTLVALDYPTHQLQSLPTICAMFALGTWERPLWLRAIGLVAPVWMVVGGSLFWDADSLELAFIAVFFVVVWGLGVLLADRRVRNRVLEARTRELEAARQELAERAVADERSRIARELHDVVAHAMSVITVQAGVGAHLGGERDDPAVEALGAIERTGREALEEMRRMLRMLRETDPDAEPRDPQPKLDDLPALFDQVRQAGVEVGFTTRGMRRELPPGLELTVYRAVQEALTNVVKHAPGSPAEVTLDFSPAELRVEVVNGVSDNARAGSEGLGLRGMAERVALYDGQMEVSRHSHEFRVTLSFPLRDSADG